MIAFIISLALSVVAGVFFKFLRRLLVAIIVASMAIWLSHHPGELAYFAQSLHVFGP